VKYLIFIAVVAFFFFFLQCVSKKKVEYDIPPHYGKEAREKSIEWFEKGKVLFKINCSGCHGIYKNGRDSIPNFTKMQIDNYNAMFIRGDPKNHSVARKLSQDQLNYILTFLRLRKIEK
jgi:hypothetical protein